MRPGGWLPAVAWMGVILWLGSDAGSAERTGRLVLPLLRFVFPDASPLQLEAMHGAARKLGHIIEYAVLAALWLRALTVGRGMARPRAAWGAWAIALVWAIVDEAWQSTLASRTGSVLDIGLDAGGALAIAVPGAFGWRPTVEVLTRALLWLAAVGGGALIAVNLLTGVESGALWITVPAAVAALVLLRRRRASASRAPRR